MDEIENSPVIYRKLFPVVSSDWLKKLMYYTNKKVLSHLKPSDVNGLDIQNQGPWTSANQHANWD